jgi:hypothetical protein
MCTKLLKNAELSGTDPVEMTRVSLRRYRGDDPSLEAPIDPSLRVAAPDLLLDSGSCSTATPRRAPAWEPPLWRPRSQGGYRFADDLMKEGLELLRESLGRLPRNDPLVMRGKLECSLAVLERLCPASGLVHRLRGGVYLLQLGHNAKAFELLAPLGRAEHDPAAQ